MNACQICGNVAGNRTHIAREMMFGLRDPFSYLECAQCGCVQLLEIPADMTRYYPPNYYSYRRHGRVMTALRHRWSAYALGRRSLVGGLLTRFVMVNRAMMAVARLGVSPQARILDVGCGSGHLLLDLKHLGYPHVTGVDPFIERDLVYEGGPTVYKRQLAEMEGPFDLIMFHHSFEHMDKPGEVFRQVARLLAPAGRVILRLPVASSAAWRRYGVHWVHLDAPRHFFLHTRQSIERLARAAGLGLTGVVQEADEGTFWASEAYARDIPLYDPRFPTAGLWRKLRTWRQTRRYRAEAAEINRRGEADLVCFYLARAA